LIAAAAFFFFLGLSILMTWPVFSRMATDLPGRPGDPEYETWILSWVSHKFVTGPSGLFDTNAFYPVKNSLAFSDHLLGMACSLFGPVYLASGNPVLAYNFTFLATFVLAGFGFWLLAFDLTGSFWAGLLAGLAFAFPPFRFQHITHMHLQSIFWIPYILIALFRYVRGGRLAWLFLFFAFYLFQITSTYYYAFYVTFVLAWAFIAALLLKREKGKTKRLFIALGASFLAVLLLALLSIPYFQVSREHGFKRTIHENTEYSSDPAEYITPSWESLLYGNLRSSLPWAQAFPERYGFFPGFAILALAAIGLLRRHELQTAESQEPPRRPDFPYRLFAFGLLAGGIIFSLGPYLVWAGKTTSIPLPFRLLYWAVPGFHSTRCPDRMVSIAIVGLAVLVGLGAAFVLKKIRSRGRMLEPAATCFLILFMLLELGIPRIPMFDAPSGDRIPAVYRWVASTPKNSVFIEYPSNDFRAMYFSIFHWRRIANGWGGFVPRDTRYFHTLLRFFPAQASIQGFRDYGIEYVLVHYRRMETMNARTLKGHIENRPDLEEAASFPRDGDFVYRIKRDGAKVLLCKPPSAQPAESGTFPDALFFEDQGVERLPAGGLRFHRPREARSEPELKEGFYRFRVRAEYTKENPAWSDAVLRIILDGVKLAEKEIKSGAPELVEASAEIRSSGVHDFQIHYEAADWSREARNRTLTLGPISWDYWPKGTLNERK
jgi:hypothetical protein